METEKIIGLIEETLEVDGLAPETVLADLEEWDSMGKLSFIVMCDDELGKSLTSDDIKGFSTVQDILDFLS